MNIGVTGYTGFVGKRAIELLSPKYKIILLDLRRPIVELDLNGIDVIIHLAGKAHQMGPIDNKIYFDINYEMTRSLSLLALENGVKHFIYISSTKVYGDHGANSVVSESSDCRPTDAYGASKLKAEKFLQSLNGMVVSIIRPPLIYGPEVKGNMLKLLHLCSSKKVLPFGNVRNARSMVFIDNLISLFDRVIEKRVSGIFIAGDATPLSTEELVKEICKHLDNEVKLISIPSFVRGMLYRFRPSLYIRLFGSFVADNKITNIALGSTSQYTSSDGIKKMVEWYQLKMR